MTKPTHIYDQLQALIPEGDKLEGFSTPPTHLDMAIAQFTKKGSSEFEGSLHAMSVRIPSIEAATIEALAKYSGLSKNKVFVLLLEVALDEVFQGLPDEDKQDICRIRYDLLRAMEAKGEPAKTGDA
jgi:hypothetical protein